jgi:hypothetical protein
LLCGFREFCVDRWGQENDIMRTVIALVLAAALALALGRITTSALDIF